jgi:hypothetical protein
MLARLRRFWFRVSAQNSDSVEQLAAVRHKADEHVDQLRRGEFITLLGGAAAVPLAARAQSEVPVIGFLSSLSSDDASHIAAAFRQGVTDTDFAEGPSVK